MAGNGFPDTMRALALLLVATSISTFPLRATVEDGLYSVSKRATDLSASAFDGEQIFLQKPLPDKIKSATIISQRNDNSLYELEINVRKFSVTPWDIVLVLNGRAVHFFGSMSDESEESTEAQIFDQQFADKAAAFFKTSVQKRQHPGHQFVGSLRTKKKTYAVGSPIPVTFCPTNCGTAPFSYSSMGFFEGKFDGDPSPAFTFSAAANNGDAVQNLPNHFWTHAMSIVEPGGVLKPQASQSIDIDLKDYLKLDKAGIYEIRGSCSFSILAAIFGIPRRSRVSTKLSSDG